jgi:hypothetical protein
MSQGQGRRNRDADCCVASVLCMDMAHSNKKQREKLESYTFWYTSVIGLSRKQR